MEASNCLGHTSTVNGLVQSRTRTQQGLPRLLLPVSCFLILVSFLVFYFRLKLSPFPPLQRTNTNH